jgi:hypothetical protein
MRKEYDFSKGEKGKYLKMIARKSGMVDGGKLVLLEPDLAKKFKDSASVNAALRAVLAVRDDIKKAKIG